MLKPFLNDFLAYCKNLNLAQNSVKELLRYIRQFDDYLQEQRLGKVNHITYKHVVGRSRFAAELLAFFCKIYILPSSQKSYQNKKQSSIYKAIRYIPAKPAESNTGMKRWLRVLAYSKSR